ncbi:MAG: hypothetical protein FD175_722 [Beijerinckiaceae bacterium]|nr:MAG: hypothetical protein FD175_722 [Beijerinckiaceae bacterium]
MTTFKKTLAAAAAALTMAVAFAPVSAEARWGRGGFLAAGLIGAAVVGTAIAASNANAGYHGSDCYRVRERVWDDYRGRFVIVRRTVCE